LELGCIIVVEDSDSKDDSVTIKEPETKGSGFKIVIVVIIVILLIGAGIFVWIFTLPGVSEVRLNLHPGEEHEIKLTCIVITENPEEYTGDGEITIEFEDGEQTYSSVVDIKEGRGEVSIWFNEFVIANGRYDITFEVEGKRITIGYDVGIVVESISQSYVTDGANPKMNIVMTDRNDNNLRQNYSQELFKFSISMDYENEGTYNSFSIDEKLWPENIYPFSFDRIGQYKRGNYTIDITFINLIVKPDSEWYTLTYHKENVRLDEAPVAAPGGPYYFSLAEPHELDASASKDDGEIVAYEWVFDAFHPQYNYKETPTSAPDGEFDGVYTPNLSRGDYEITLIVSDDNYPTPHNVSATFEVSVTLT
jgi:hypothetical protein